jgi:hypothetical protein
VALIWLTLAVLDSFRTYYTGPWCSVGCVLRHMSDQLFTLDSSKCSDECLGQLIVTTPVLNGIAYSVGAWIGLRSFRVKPAFGSASNV